MDAIDRLRYAYGAPTGHAAIVRRNDIGTVLDSLDFERDRCAELARKCNSLTALLAQAEADNRAWAERCRWIPVGEKMPEAGQRVHVWDGRDQGVGVPLAGFRGGWATTHGVPPTHWRPLDPGPDAT